MVVLCFSTTNVAICIRDMQAFEKGNGSGFYTGYNPQLWPSLIISICIAIICVAIGAKLNLKRMIFPVLFSIVATIRIYRDHFDPFYRDWGEDTFWAKMGYLSILVLAFFAYDTLTWIATRVKRKIQPGEVVNASSAAGLPENHLHD